jgi:NAD(P)-dependent dehydrogenase (short-subunit alcohol dehydrogenase family)
VGMLTAKMDGDDGRPAALVGFTRDHLDLLLQGAAMRVDGDLLGLGGDVVIVAADVSDPELANAVVSAFDHNAGRLRCSDWEAARGFDRASA